MLHLELRRLRDVYYLHEQYNWSKTIAHTSMNIGHFLTVYIQPFIVLLRLILWSSSLSCPAFTATPSRTTELSIMQFLSYFCARGYMYNSKSKMPT